MMCLVPATVATALLPGGFPDRGALTFLLAIMIGSVLGLRRIPSTNLQLGTKQILRQTQR